ncbi:methionyl-tRNA formyltransferase [Roseateles sp. SL47]|uniref:methionyl-tRNA formyltransferase n=1 Tax=Roseateles sp. SL47 TaxID=2995138 RepID=UPI00227146E3|nr:methionyl-tRNA formyltransferase [Roseateles sp. SL47]WAC75742.1 methionyl-tRNA formyltransferase [Roseateles sp. SL47]
MRVGFAGTPEFAAVALQALLDAGITVPLVLSQPDRPAGRGMKLQASPVKQLAVRHDIPVAQPRSLRLDGKFADEAETGRAALEAARLDVLVVAAYGLILPAWVLTQPRLGCLNIHASLLPRWRGAAPIHRAIEAGDAETGITIMQMDEGLDTGDMLLEDREPIAADDTTARLHDRLAAMGGRLILTALAQAATGRLQPRRQPEAGVTYAHKIDKAESQIRWTDDASQIARRLRAFDPFPGGVAQLDEESLKIWRAEVVASVDALPASTQPGDILSVTAEGPVVACGQGAVRLLELQRAGGKRLPAAAFLQSRPLRPGERLS